MSILALTWMQGPIIAYTLVGPIRDPNMNMGGGGGGGGGGPGHPYCQYGKDQVLSINVLASR